MGSRNVEPLYSIVSQYQIYTFHVKIPLQRVPGHYLRQGPYTKLHLERDSVALEVARLTPLFSATGYRQLQHRGDQGILHQVCHCQDHLTSRSAITIFSIMSSRCRNNNSLAKLRLFEQVIMKQSKRGIVIPVVHIGPKEIMGAVEDSACLQCHLQHYCSWMKLNQKSYACPHFRSRNSQIRSKYTGCTCFGRMQQNTIDWIALGTVKCVWLTVDYHWYRYITRNVGFWKLFHKAYCTDDDT